MEKIVVLGKGGHAKSVVEVIERQGIYKVAGYVVNDCDILEGNDYPVIGKDKELRKIYQEGIQYAAIGIGFLGKSRLRNKLYATLKEIGFLLPVICDPSAIVSKKIYVEEGTFLGKGTVINAGVRIGKMCIINTGAIIEHDCQIGDFSHIAVGTVLCGGIQIGCETLIGANATIIQGRKIGNRCIVGAGEIVKNDLEDSLMFYKGKKI